MPKLTGKVIVVIGGSRGIGLAIARACGDEGAKVVVVGRERGVLRQASRKVAGRALPIVADVTRPAQVTRLFRRVRERYGHIDALVNSAGVFTFKPFARTTLSDWR